MNEEAHKLGRTSAAFALSAGITALFNTSLACAKDANLPLKHFMASLSDHDWTTQGIADVILFILLGVIFLNTGLATKARSTRLILWLAGSVTAAGVGLFAWYAFY